MANTTTTATVDPLAQLTAIKALESARRAQHKSAAAAQKAASALKNANQAHKATAGSVTAAFEQLAPPASPRACSATSASLYRRCPPRPWRRLRLSAQPPPSTTSMREKECDD